MKADQTILWTKIDDFELDDPSSSLTFSHRLANENDWTLEYSLRTIHEYKRFMFLICIADHALTPSDQVDQVWHLHLVYTQSYWIDFCQEILNRQIHHGPTKGGSTEREKYDDLYERTLNIYTQTFGENPPEDIWPNKTIRFSDIHFRRINLKKNWIIKKPFFFRS